MPGSALDLRIDLAARLNQARARTDAFFALLAEPTLYERAIPERHRVVFYLGHLEAFDWNLIARDVCGRTPFDANLDSLFAFGIDPVDGQLPQDVPADWPALPEIRAYVTRARAAIDECLAGADVSADGPEGLARGHVFQIAIEHRLMHAETLAYMLPHLPLEGFARRVWPDRQPGPVQPGYARTGGPGRVRRVGIAAGSATLGLSRHAGVFGWDNEFDEHVVHVPAFSIDARNVTNGEFLEFVRAGGYRNGALWRPDDWEWKVRHEVQHPALWRRRGADWWIRSSFAEIALPRDWPVQVSLAEARAYARWRGRELPTEAQFHRAAYGTRLGEERPFPWGDAHPDARIHGNFDFLRFDPSPVAAFPAGDSAFGVADLIGNGWEWTETPFAPFDGFDAFVHYPGYSANFFDGKHYVIKGASPQTDHVFLRRSFRNWFQPYYPYVFAAFRTVDGG
ncbi:MAG: SUMF1/EgtB/PvdO family nonheme iron enzyme [Candidatus Eiseniibacteriota bacterium]